MVQCLPLGGAEESNCPSCPNCTNCGCRPIAATATWAVAIGRSIGCSVVHLLSPGSRRGLPAPMISQRSCASCTPSGTRQRGARQHAFPTGDHGIARPIGEHCRLPPQRAHTRQPRANQLLRVVRRPWLSWTDTGVTQNETLIQLSDSQSVKDTGAKGGCQVAPQRRKPEIQTG